VLAAAALAPGAPFDAEGLDFFDGMGEQNVEDIKAVFEGEEAHLAVLEREREELLATSPEQLADVLKTLLGPADREVLTGRVAAFLLENMQAALKRSVDGWFDDDVALTQPWGFDLASIRVPVVHWQASRTSSFPSATASGSPGTSPASSLTSHPRTATSHSSSAVHPRCTNGRSSTFTPLREEGMSQRS